MNNEFQNLLSERFGMFVHYGIYSEIGGIWNGKSVKHSVHPLGEWIMREFEIPVHEYEDFAKKNFAPSKDFAKIIVNAAKTAGAKYIVLTSKHHDGFCLFKTEHDSYNSYEYCGRDLCRELADECRKEGVELGFYYSHALDWHEKNGGGNLNVFTGSPSKDRNDWDFPEQIDFSEYFYKKCLPQVKELLTNYGPLKLIWFDIARDITYEQSQKLRNTVKKLQPDCLINSRIGHGFYDYISLGDNQLSLTPSVVGTECLVTLNHTWGYISDDNDYKSPQSIISILARTLACNSTLLLNIGPMGDGSLTPETERILEKLGEWTRKNADAVYGPVTANDYVSTADFGYTAKKDNKLFFYVFKEAKKVSLGGLINSPKRVYRLSDERELTFNLYDGVLSFAPVSDEDCISVYVAEFSSEPRFCNHMCESDGILSMKVAYASKLNKNLPEKKIKIEHQQIDLDGIRDRNGFSISYSGTIFDWKSANEAIVFEAEIKSGGEYVIELLHTAASESDFSSLDDIGLTVSVDGQTNRVGPEECRRMLSKTGVFNSIIVRRAGTVKLTPGIHKFTVERLFDGDNIPIVELSLHKI